MNKIQFVFVCLAFVAMAFTIGYRVGDSRGYEAGYIEGYRYDCREEIANLYDQVKANRKFIESANETIRNTLRENDSLKNPQLYQKRYQDSLNFAARFSADSAKNWKRARRQNDSIMKALGKGYGYANFIQPDGRVNIGLCMLDSVMAALPECDAVRGRKPRK